MLKTLCKKDYLIASGIGRGTHYRLNEAYALTHAYAPVNAQPNAPLGRNKNSIINELYLFCSVWKKVNEMARHIGKTPKYVSRHLIPEMIERGLLIREYPNNPHHPAQRYRTKPKNGSKNDS